MSPRALYLRPAAVVGTGLDQAVKAWLVAKGFEPVDAGEANHIVYLPYDGGGNYYHRDVSVEMALAIVEAIRDGRNVRGVEVKDTDVETLTEGGIKVEALVEARLDWDDSGYGGRETLAILTPDDQREAEANIRETLQISYHDLGQVWRPDWKPPPQAQRPPVGIPISRSEIGKLKLMATEAPDGMIRRAPDAKAGVFEWFEMFGLVEACEVDGTMAWRITSKGRERAAS